MRLEELREIARSRTAGEWRYEAERYSAKCVIGLTNDDRWVATCQPEFNGESNGKMIVAMSKHIDALLDLWEAARSMGNHALACEVVIMEPPGPCDCGFDNIHAAINKLEAIK